MKETSSYGRLFIWKLTLQHASDNVFNAIGFGNFSLCYPRYQIQYFENSFKIPVRYFLTADETHIAFNEYLQIFIETGVIGLSVFIAFFFIVLKRKINQNKLFQSALKLTVSAILISGLFSYPFHTNAISFVLIFCVALLNNSEPAKLEIPFINLWAKLLCIVLSLFISATILFKSVKQTLAIANWENLRENYFLTPKQIEKDYQELYSMLAKNGKFLNNYGNRLCEINDLKKGVVMLDLSKNFFLTYNTFISCANAYYQLHDINNTVRNLQEAIHLIPSKFASRYLLAKVYFEGNDTLRAKQEARFILSMPVKKETAEVYIIKNQTLDLLDSINKVSVKE